MKKEWADKWIAWLRDPNNKQTRGVLFDGIGYCCLGGLCRLAGLEPVKSHGDYFFEKQMFTLPFSVQALTGITFMNGSTKLFGRVTINEKNYVSLTDANDNGVPFSSIADWIEQNWANL